MQPLYTITFTTKTLVKKIGPKGKIVSETALEKPITMTALPYATAMSYSGCDNFAIERYVLEGNGRPARDKSVGNGTRKIGHVSAEARSSNRVTRRVAKSASVSKAHDAASTGNLAAAINA